MKKITDYTPVVAAGGAYDHGKLKNEASPGAADGTPIDADIVTDVLYAMYAVMKHTGVTPSSVIEDTDLVAGTHDFLDALKLLMKLNDNPFMNYAYLRDEQTAGTAAGAFTSGAWRTRDINTVAVNRIAGASIASNQVTLPAGTYRVKGSAPTFDGAVDVGTHHRARLYDTTGSAVLAIGQGGAHDGTTARDRTLSDLITGEFTLSIQSVLELQHWTTASIQFGNAMNIDSLNEVYSEIEIWKLD